MIGLHRRRPADVADLSTLQATIDHERAHSAEQSRKLATAREDIRRLVDDVDTYRGRNRELVGQVLALKAQLRSLEAVHREATA